MRAGSVFDAPAQDVERVIAVLDTRLGDYRLEPAARARLTDEFELYARDIATRAHVAAKATVIATDVRVRFDLRAYMRPS